MTVGAIRAAGLELRPTFRRPYYTVIFPSLDDGVRRLRSCDNEVIKNHTTTRNSGSAMNQPIDIWVDFASQDDTGLPWSLLSEADDPARVVAGAFIVAGNDQSAAVVEVVDVQRDGVVHLRPQPASVAANAHLLRSAVT